MNSFYRICANHVSLFLQNLLDLILPPAAFGPFPYSARFRWTAGADSCFPLSPRENPAAPDGRRHAAGAAMAQYQNFECGIYWYGRSNDADLSGKGLRIFCGGVCLCVELPDFAALKRIFLRRPNAGDGCSSECARPSRIGVGIRPGSISAQGWAFPYPAFHSGPGGRRSAHAAPAGRSRVRNCLQRGDLQRGGAETGPASAVAIGFETTCDTEVILCGYMEYGMEVAQKAQRHLCLRHMGRGPRGACSSAGTGWGSNPCFTR